MAIAIGQHAANGTPAFTTVTSITTPSKTTSASGSTFVLNIFSSTAIAGSTPVQDSFSNSYTLKETLTTQFGSVIVYTYICDNGSGGAGHTATANLSSAAHCAIFFTEVTGAANPSFDAGNTINNNSTSTRQVLRSRRPTRMTCCSR